MEDKRDAELELHEINHNGNGKHKHKKKSKQNGTEGKQNGTDGQTVDYNEDKFFGSTRIGKDDPHYNDEDVVIAMKNVHKTYLLGIEGVPALRGVSLTIKRGEFVCIFGTSGGGKTTLLNIMGTIDKPTKGELKLGGVRVTNSTKDSELSDIRLAKLGFVFQTFNLLSALTALENVEMPMILHGVLTQAERKQRATELLEMVGLGKRTDHVPSQLSGGEQQRVTIARAIANNPEILLLDEPTGDLDTINTHIVLKLLTELNQKNNITMVMVTHDVALKNFADRTIWMRDGKIQRIEVVSKQRKVDAIRKLEEELAIQQAKKQAKATGEAKPISNLVEVRKPMDYKTHAHFVQNNGGKSFMDNKEEDSSGSETEDVENSHDSITSTKSLIPEIDRIL